VDGGLGLGGACWRLDDGLVIQHGRGSI
jgi:hypothetical protein